MNWEKDQSPFLLQYLHLFFLLVCLSLPGGLSHRVSSFLGLLLPCHARFCQAPCHLVWWMQVTVACLCLLFCPPWWVVVTCPSFLCLISNIQLLLLGPRPGLFWTTASVSWLALSFLTLSYSQVRSRLLGAPLPDAQGMPSVLGGGVGLLQRVGMCTEQQGSGIPASIPGSLQVGAGWLLFN